MSPVTRWTALGGAVLAVSLSRSMGDGPSLVDESWFLQVIHRVRSGDVLYRDVFFGATPLSVYLTAALTYLTGIEIVAVKIVTNASFAVAVLLACSIALRVGLPRYIPAWLAAASIVFARPYASPPYTPLASAFLLATAAGALMCAERARSAAVGTSRTGGIGDLLTGSVAGLAFAAKQNIGLLALAAALAAIPVAGSPTAGRRDRIYRSMLTAAGFGCVVSIVLWPVLASGGLAGLWEYGFAGKGAYLQYGRVSYLASLGGWLSAAGDLPSLSAAVTLLHGGILMLPLAAAAAVGRLLWQRGLDRPGVVLVLFGIASVLSAFPRWDRFHLAYAVPILVVILVYVLNSRGWLPAGGNGLRRTSRAALVACLFLVLLRPAASLVSGSARPSRLPHFRGAFLAPADERRLAQAGARLAAASAGSPVFVLRPQAGSLYLASGVQNPTPFDMPAVTAVGRPGTPELLSQLSRGAIPLVCIDPDSGGGLRLIEVEAFVLDHFERTSDIGPCALYRAGGRAAEFSSSSP